MTFAAAMMVGAGAYADGNITGRLLDKEGRAVDFATVVLVDPATGTPLPGGTLTDSEGAFILENVPSGRYMVRFSSVGFLPVERPVEIADSPADVGNVEIMDDARLLEEVVVSGERRQLSIGTEKRVFNVSSNIVSSGATAEELLAAVPSVGVSSDGDISLRGNDDVLVWINGKEMGLTADNRAMILRQIPAGAVESIEVLTNPSSKHSTQGTAGIINIRLREESRRGYFGSAEASGDSRGSANAAVNVTFSRDRFDFTGGLGLKSQRTPGGVASQRMYDQGWYLDTEGDKWRRENSLFLRLGVNWRPDDANLFYMSGIGTLGRKRGESSTWHSSNLPGQWVTNFVDASERGSDRGGNLMIGYRHDFAQDHRLDMNVSYNVWQGSNDTESSGEETLAGGNVERDFISQHQDMRLSNWEAAVDYTLPFGGWLRLESGYKGNYNHENSPASYAAGPDAMHTQPLDNLYNRFKYDTDISALYLTISGEKGNLSFSAGLRGELWQISTRSLGYGESDSDVALFRKRDFGLFPSLSAGWKPADGSELRLSYSRRIRRPYGPQLNTFENISDPSEVHLGNPLILPEYSDAVELGYTLERGGHMLGATGYLRVGSDVISHVSFLAPMASDPDVNTMYYGHANVGETVNAGVELVSRNPLFGFLTLTTTVNLYNSHLRAWENDYPLHGSYYTVRGQRQNRFVWDLRCMASVRLPWDLSLQVSGRYSSRRVTAQGTIEPDWDVEAGLRRSFGPWSLSLMCKDIFNSRKSHEVLYGNGYTQSVNKWNGHRTLRLSLSYSFGRSRQECSMPHNHIDTGGYGEGAHEH